MQLLLCSRGVLTMLVQHSLLAQQFRGAVSRAYPAQREGETQQTQGCRRMCVLTGTLNLVVCRLKSPLDLGWASPAKTS